MYKTQAAPSNSAGSGNRVVSVDALRGFDMFWILGGERIVETLDRSHGSSWTHIAAGQMQHSSWDGFSAYDLIFPMFVFIAGVSIVFSLSKVGGNKAAAIRRILFRSISLFALGILYYGGLANAWPGIRVLGVLQRIALCYLAASLLFIYFRPRTLAIVTTTILLGYWAVMLWVPIHGHRGDLSVGNNIADRIDQVALPGRLWNGNHDPEGLFSTLPAIATCLLGVFAGLLLRGPSAPWKKVIILLLGGALCTAVGMAWGGMFPELAFLKPLQIPVNKQLWTSSFVLVAGGWSAMLLGVFYLLIDVWNLTTWATPFVWIGMNAIAMYLIAFLVEHMNFGSLTKHGPAPQGNVSLAGLLIGGDFARWLGRDAGLVLACVSSLIIFLIARFFYKKQVFIRL